MLMLPTTCQTHFACRDGVLKNTNISPITDSRSSRRDVRQVTAGFEKTEKVQWCMLFRSLCCADAESPSAGAQSLMLNEWIAKTEVKILSFIRLKSVTAVQPFSG